MGDLLPGQVADGSCVYRFGFNFSRELIFFLRAVSDLRRIRYGSFDAVFVLIVGGKWFSGKMRVDSIFFTGFFLPGSAAGYHQ